MPNAATFQTLLEAALTARENAHAPYSNFHVGAAILLADDSIFAACNVENASYGATICAERFAVGTAIAARGKIEIRAVLVVTDSEKPAPPCGMCRQVLSEFCHAQTLVHTVNLSGDVITFRFAELLPHAFNGEFLKP